MQGVAFLWQKKAGLVLGVTWGFGFVLARLPVGGVGQQQSWSAPCFITTRALSLGLTIGVQVLDSCRLAATSRALRALYADKFEGSLDVTVMAGFDPATLDAPIRKIQPPEMGAEKDETQRVFCMSDGIMLDLSCSCECAWGLPQRAWHGMEGHRLNPIKALPWVSSQQCLKHSRMFMCARQPFLCPKSHACSCARVSPFFAPKATHAIPPTTPPLPIPQTDFTLWMMPSIALYTARGCVPLTSLGEWWLSLRSWPLCTSELWRWVAAVGAWMGGWAVCYMA
jgi:hypothetical protein